MSRQLRGRRWSEISEEAQPFGMPFVDIVASALICMVALLILWLQLINPLGHIPGHKQEYAKPTRSTEGQAGTSSGDSDEGNHRYDAPGVLLSLVVQWLNDSNRESISIHVQCGDDRQLSISPNSDGYAATTIRIDKASTDCRVSAKSGDGKQGNVVISSRVITEGKQVVATQFNTGDASQNVLSGSRELMDLLGKKQGERWPFKWK